MDDSTRSSEALLRFDEPGSNRAIVLEDDGRVAYAYLLEGEELVGDVWLYNVAETPTSVDWEAQAEMPFLNPKEYCKIEEVPRLAEDSMVDCRWSESGVDVLVDGLHLAGLHLARLAPGARPGWSRLALRPGPLAKPLDG